MMKWDAINLWHPTWLVFAHILMCFLFRVVKLESTFFVNWVLSFQRTDAKIGQEYEKCKLFPFRALFYNYPYGLLGKNANFWEKCTFLFW